MTSVATGQLWDVAATGSARIGRFRIERVEDGMAYGTMVATGRSASFHTSTLERHMRGARLVQNHDRQAAANPSPDKPPAAHEPTASDYRRVTAPRGLTPAQRKDWIRRGSTE
jgi:hypothetical protein